MKHSDHASLAAAEPADAPDAVISTSPEPITPELVLVSPELAEEARSRMPDHPWEVPRRRARPSGLRRPASAERDRAGHGRSALATRSDPPDAASGALAGRPQLRRRFLLTGVVVAVLVFGVSSSEFRTSPMERLTTSEPPVRAASGKRTEKAPLRLLPSAGYVVSPDGSFMTAGSGRTIDSFTLPLRCGGGRLVIRNIAVAGGLLRFSGRAVGQAVTVTLRGRLLDRKHVRGMVRAVGSPCGSRSVVFAARVS